MKFSIFSQFSILQFLKHSFFKLSPILLFNVSGRSMFPALKHGDRVVVTQRVFTKLEVGEIVVLYSPQNNLPVVKRIKDIDNDRIFVIGDNKKESRDSRGFGWIDKKKIIGKVIGKI